jgi:hypothetical protein
MIGSRRSGPLADLLRSGIREALVRDAVGPKHQMRFGRHLVQSLPCVPVAFDDLQRGV